ncbi:MAG: DM13 domain-containing protein [Hyphomicrobiaceae bacterium]
MLKALVLTGTHLAMAAIGFMAGVYTLPILTAPKGPEAASLQATARAAVFKGRFDRNLKGSDFLHWGEGEVSVARDKIGHDGRLAPGPDYKLYLTTDFVDDKSGFLKIKGQARLIGDVKTFNGFLLPVPDGVDVGKYTTVVVWCESFSAFISAAKYR